MKKIILLLGTSLLLACQHKTTHPFLQTLNEHCGKTYYGESVFPEDPGEAFAGKVLKMHIRDCGNNEVRIPFQVGEDTSRTWIITHSPEGLLLKHDHRHKDGTPDEITMYGGYANARGNETRQHFEADAHTQKLIPEASTNVWMMEWNPEEKTFVYYLERHNKPRYKAVFQVN